MKGDNITLGPTSYFFTNINRWAINNVGLFIGSNNPQYINSMPNQFISIVNLDIFQTAHLSTSSLRY